MEIYLIPAWLWNRIDASELVSARVRMHLGYFLSNVLVVAALPFVRLVPHFCLMRTLVRLPCPGCGVTHALLLVMSLHFRASLLANPAGLVIAATIAFQLLGRPLAMADERASPFITRASRWLGQASVAALLTAWVATLVKLAL